MTTWLESPWLVLDTETTGLGPTSRIVELAAVEMCRGEPTGPARRALIDPGIPIPAEATAVHGIDDAAVKGCPTIEAIAPGICARVAAAQVIVAYNAPYDLEVLDRTCPGFAEARAHCLVYDPLVVVRFAFHFWKGSGRHKLTSAYERLALEPLPEMAKAHSAKWDAIMAGRIGWALKAYPPPDLVAARDWLATKAAAQEAEFQAWRARQASAPNSHGAPPA